MFDEGRERRGTGAAAGRAEAVVQRRRGGDGRGAYRLTALPRDEFDATYRDWLRRSWRVIAALKVREAHVVPRFATAEDSSRMAEVMSFALAACGVAERVGQALGRAAEPDWCPTAADVPEGAVLKEVHVPRSFGALVLPRLLGEAGHEWLGQQPEALREAAAYFGSGRLPRSPSFRATRGWASCQRSLGTGRLRPCPGRCAFSF